MRLISRVATGTQKQPSLLQKVMGQPKQQASQGATRLGARAIKPPPARPFLGPKASQGPSKLDALFSQLKTPVKSSQRAKVTPLKDKVTF